MGAFTVASLLPTHAGWRPNYMAEAVDHLVTAPTSGEAFSALAGRLLGWLSCQLVVLQVKVDDAEPLLFQAGGGVPLPGIGVHWRESADVQAEALARGELLVDDDLWRSFTFGEDANLIRAGLRSAVRGALHANGREIGRFGLFAQNPCHFTPDRVQILRELIPALVWLCRQMASGADEAGDDGMSRVMEEVLAGAEQGLYPAVQASKRQLSRLIPAAGILVAVEVPGPTAGILTDLVGVAVPGAPDTSNPNDWRVWLHELPPDGHLEPAAWILPVIVEGESVGAVGIAYPQMNERPEHWERRLRPITRLLATLVAQERERARFHLAVRAQLAALTAGLSDEIGNLVTELALQLDLLDGCAAGNPDATRRIEALFRVVEKGSDLGTRLDHMAASLRQPQRWEPLDLVVERVRQQLRTYRGCQHVSLESALGEHGRYQVEAGMVEQALVRMVLSVAERHSSELTMVLRGYPAGHHKHGLLLLLSPGHGNQPDWSLELATGRADSLKLEIPVRQPQMPMEG